MHVPIKQLDLSRRWPNIETNQAGTETGKMAKKHDGVLCLAGHST
jgi:hypothetical protein